MRSEDRVTLQRMIDYCNDVQTLMDEYRENFQDYKNKISFQYSSNMCIIQIGELVSRLSEEFIEEHKKIPWHAIKAMRNLRAHDYDRVDLSVVWKTLTEEIPDLKQQLEIILGAGMMFRAE